MKAIKAIRAFSLACIRGFQSGSIALFHCHIRGIAEENDLARNKYVVVNLSREVPFTPGTTVAVEFSVAIPVLECIFAMLKEFSENNFSPVNSLEPLLLDPENIADCSCNSSIEGRESWRRLVSDPSNLQRYSLNEKQTRALERAFAHKVTVIQGPPGTGKTKTGASLAHLWALTNQQEPIPIA